MDNTSDNKIRFDSNGYCNYCVAALAKKDQVYFSNDVGKHKVETLVCELKEANKNSKYDCMMGISGGLDSTYLAYLGYIWGLRIVCVHVDDGFDSDITKKNLEKFKNATNFDFISVKIDVEQYNALLKAFLRAGVPNIAMPQDNILFATVYEFAKKKKIKNFLSGTNFALECILQADNTHTAFDHTNIKDINRKYGTTSIDKLLLATVTDRFIWKTGFGVQTITPLNYIDYNRKRALNELADFCGFEYYGGKHLENILTAFAQLYWFPKKFNVDKRTSHLSSMIISGQITRDEALKEYNEKPLYDDILMDEYIHIIKEKLNLTDDEFNDIMAAEARQHEEFKINIKLKLLKF